MKSRSRREIINELKDLRRENGSLSCALQMSRMAEIEQKRDRDYFRDRLAELGNDHDLKYMKGADRGTLVSSVTVEPEHITIGGTTIPGEVNAELARKLADAIIEKGLMRVETDPDNYPPPRFGVRVIGRIDVIPWDKICSRTARNVHVMLPPQITETRRGNMVEITLERGTPFDT